MTVVQVNTTCTAGSTGTICCAVSRLLDEQGVENYILHTQGGCNHPRGIRYAGKLSVKIAALKSRVLGTYGFTARMATRRLLRRLDALNPTVVHLHNLHGHNIHLGMLMDYLQKRGIKVFWTFHDCWAFTAYCPHFDAQGCAQWEKGCRHCPQRKRYSWFWDRSPRLQGQKQAAIQGVDLTIIAPSVWMAETVKRSFLRAYPASVIRNGIDLTVFHPTESEVRTKLGLTDRKMVLGVAYKWSTSKGIDVFERLATRLDADYQIVLVGVDEKTAKRLPQNICCLPPVTDAASLAALYTAADVFVNPTREETLGLTNVEALACGTPVVTFRAGGSPECVDETCGLVVEREDVDGLVKAICRAASGAEFSSSACQARAAAFDAKRQYQEYVKLYGIDHEYTATETI